MDTALAYLISVGIVGFGVWIATAAKVGAGIFPITMVTGLMIIAVGLISLLNEIHNSRAASI
jgi:uncharacterized membrane protein YiaA